MFGDGGVCGECQLGDAPHRASVSACRFAPDLAPQRPRALPPSFDACHRALRSRAARQRRRARKISGERRAVFAADQAISRSRTCGSSKRSSALRRLQRLARSSLWTKGPVANSQNARAIHQAAAPMAIASGHPQSNRSTGAPQSRQTLVHRRLGRGANRAGQELDGEAPRGCGRRPSRGEGASVARDRAGGAAPGVREFLETNQQVASGSRVRRQSRWLSAQWSAPAAFPLPSARSCAVFGGSLFSSVISRLRPSRPTPRPAILRCSDGGNQNRPNSDDSPGWGAIAIRLAPASRSGTATSSDRQ